ncbi:helix-turn-helix domain-containing protein [Antribacter gilvus]|uniref:helix-turn-helix domain-containing protein n=1 Tax=Antribacter gilvus TaxID=2304675 RepID=UPI000F7B29AF|nr:helix-turn-helix domain-containing protein [Antribacter gilvus]
MSAETSLVPEPADAELAQSALPELEDALKSDGPVHLRFGDGADVVVPRTALAALAEVLSSFAQGEGVAVLPVQSELTTQQAADALNVSRPFLIGLLEAGKIEYRTVGTHRRVRAASLVAYEREDSARRRAAADALTAEG